MQSIEKAARLAVSVLPKIIHLIKPGVSEKQIAQEIKKYIKPAFRIIVASGKRSAKPHGFAANKKLKRGDLVVIDFGAVYNGYRSDISRTYVVGKPTKKQRKLLAIIKMSQAKAVRVVRANRRCSDVDFAARQYIKKQGFGKNFIHSTGHGIGRQVHQAPKISKGNRRRLRVGDVITIEPGIYIKGYGGVRIEDMVVVTPKSCKVLTR
ncbi:M24 family metallopeptidase [Candidatus Margulisiibacteriota bacterium]